MSEFYEWRYPTQPPPSFEASNVLAFNSYGKRRLTAVYNAASRYVEYDAASVVVWCEARDALAQAEPPEALTRSDLEGVTTRWLDYPIVTAESLRSEADRIAITLGAELHDEQGSRDTATLE
ncbi:MULTISPECIES: hypothetical protein [unclassified Rathayibacter]|uniref:hypothetical protein n=1 Tax=unclassified Rathayibacter TaxID=2609250 RepID=UPI00188B4316|nr:MULTISPECIES: hypothetical protein [unclassified Rathayibacter]MBF4461230.1 hypothetical protein [Rathayibacter sp. VKM Ac-2879]MBF4502641.1 hypothetical protein [Rathayibacter sp. VKM Ac-2878]